VTSVLAFVVVIGVLVFVHELGHFMMARRHGVRVITFSLGFGPKLVSVRRGDTEYCLSAIPLGGYVKMAGENAREAGSGGSDEFLSKSRWQRFQILIMGPVMNILLAILAMWIVLYRPAQIPAYSAQPPVVGSVTPGGPADLAGIRKGDRIDSIEGHPIDNWERFGIEILSRGGRETTVVVHEAGGSTRTVQLVPKVRGETEVADIGVSPWVQPQIRAVNPDGPADRAGLQSGDVIAAVNGKPMPYEEVLETVKAAPEAALELTIVRHGAQRTVTVTPDEGTEGGGVIGVTLGAELRTVNPRPLEALQLSLERNYDWSLLIFRTLRGLVTGGTSPRELMGPIGIARLSGSAVEIGWLPLVTLMALISLNLGVVNLMPIPVLDGGHIMILGLEGIARRDFSAQIKGRLMFAGFMVLMALMATVIYNDLTRISWIGRLMPWR
jgi:regulator of sigma E protease